MKHTVAHSTEHGEVVTANRSTPAGDDRWDWEIRLEGPSEVLDAVERVEYVLHETFPNPVRVRDNRDDGFSLESNGWGEFDVGIKVHFKDGGVEKLRHPLRLWSRARDE